MIFTDTFRCKSTVKKPMVNGFLSCYPKLIWIQFFLLLSCRCMFRKPNEHKPFNVVQFSMFKYKTGFFLLFIFCSLRFYQYFAIFQSIWFDQEVVFFYSDIMFHISVGCWMPTFQWGSVVFVRWHKRNCIIYSWQPFINRRLSQNLCSGINQQGKVMEQITCIWVQLNDRLENKAKFKQSKMKYLSICT